ncbi:MAG: hypothetical protein IJF77_06815, partial [Alistipes sp.]|nr:hypothetical protein [Alistipes sp.]
IFLDAGCDFRFGIFTEYHLGRGAKYKVFHACRFDFVKDTQVSSRFISKIRKKIVTLAVFVANKLPKCDKKCHLVASWGLGKRFAEQHHKQANNNTYIN